MSRRLVNMRLDEEFLARVDAEAGRLGQTRTKFVERALEQALDDRAQGSPGVRPPAMKAPSPAPPRTSGPDAPVADRENFPRVVPRVPGVVRASSLVKQGVKPIPKGKS